MLRLRLQAAMVLLVLLSSACASDQVHSDRIPMSAEHFTGEMLVEVRSPTLVESRTSGLGGLKDAIYSAEVVTVHSDRELSASADPGTVSFFSPYWEDEGPLLRGTDLERRLYLLVRTTTYPAETIARVGTALEVGFAFTSDTEGLDIEPVARGRWTDEDIVTVISESLSAVESSGLAKGDVVEIGPRVGAMLDAFNQPGSEIQELLTPVGAPATISDPADELLGDPSYSAFEVGGVHVAGGSYFVGLQTASGVDTGLPLSPDSPFLSATVPLAVGESIEIGVWIGEEEPSATRPDFAMTYVPDDRVWTSDGSHDMAESAVLLSVGAEGVLVDARTTTMDEFFQVALRTQGPVEVADVTESES